MTNAYLGRRNGGFILVGPNYRFLPPSASSVLRFLNQCFPVKQGQFKEAHRSEDLY